MRPQMAADVGGEPEPVKADGDQLEPGTAFAPGRRNSPRSPEKAAFTDEAGNGGGAGKCGTELISFTTIAPFKIGGSET